MGASRSCRHGRNYNVHKLTPPDKVTSVLFFLISGKNQARERFIGSCQHRDREITMCVCVFLWACVRAQQTYCDAPVIVFSFKGSPTTHHPPGPGQPDAGAGRRVAAEVSGVWGARAHRHLEEERSQPGREGPPLLPAGARQPSDPEHQGSGSRCSGRGGDPSLGECEDSLFSLQSPLLGFFYVFPFFYSGSQLGLTQGIMNSLK